MNIQQYMASQLKQPSGIIGKFVLGRLWNKRNAALNDATLVQLALKQTDKALEVGFGGGYLLQKIMEQIPQGFVSGVDASPVMVRNAQTRFRKELDAGLLTLHCGQAEALPLIDASVTKVCSVNSLFYWSDVYKGLSELFRVLSDSGRVALTFTRREDLEHKGFAQYGVHTFEAREILQMLTQIGFKELQESRAHDCHREFICITGVK